MVKNSKKEDQEIGTCLIVFPAKHPFSLLYYRYTGDIIGTIHDDNAKSGRESTLCAC